MFMDMGNVTAVCETQPKLVTSTTETVATPEIADQSTVMVSVPCPPVIVPFVTVHVYVEVGLGLDIQY